MTVTLRDLRFAEAQRDQCALNCQSYMTAGHLAFLYEAMLRVYRKRSKWQKRRKAGRMSA